MSVKSILSLRDRRLTRHLLHVDSSRRDRTRYPNPNHYTVPVLYPYVNVRRVAITHMELANTLYAVEKDWPMTIEVRDYDILNETPISGYNVILRAGNYTNRQLAEFINSSNIVTGTARLLAYVSATTGQLFFASHAVGLPIPFLEEIPNPTATPPALEFRIFNAHPIFGHRAFETDGPLWRLVFDSLSTVDRNVTAPVISHTKNVIFLKIGELKNYGRTISTGRHDTDDSLFARVQLPGNPFEICLQTWEDPLHFRDIPDSHRFDISREITVTWVNADNKLVDFNNVDHTFCLAIYTDNADFP